MANLLENYKKDILENVIRAFDSDNFGKALENIPSVMLPDGSTPKFKGDIESERAIIKDSVIYALGMAPADYSDDVSLVELAEKAMNREQPEADVISVSKKTCNGCMPSRIFVTDICQGCTARPCQEACKFGAISMRDGHSYIDQEKCKKCGMCVKACPYSAIAKTLVPCSDTCPVAAIGQGSDGLAEVDQEKCLSCGRCVKACPFGATHEKSQIIDVIKAVKAGKKVVPMLAPAAAAQMDCTMAQFRTAFLQMGFFDVYEVAFGADVTTRKESKEFVERMEEGEPFMTTSCCAGYCQLIKKHVPEISHFVSDTKPPMYYISEIVKERVPEAVTVFVSPCSAKKMEAAGNPNVDYVINMKEMAGLFAARGIDVTKCDETPFPDSHMVDSKNYAFTGGVATAVKNFLPEDTDIKPFIINGLNKDYVRYLKKIAKDKVCPDGNIVEVMCCDGGCVGGNGNIQSDPKKAMQKLIKIASSAKQE